MKRLQNKKVLITGGSSGIGLALAKKFCAFDAHICLLARRQDILESARDEIVLEYPEMKDSIHLISADVGDYISLENKLRSYIDTFDYPDILINSAGITYPGEFLKLEWKIFEDIIRSNYLGTVYTTKIIAPGMVARKSGHIVNISSQSAYIGFYGYSAYGSSKAALQSFSRTLRGELKAYNVDVSIVYPQDTDTPQLAFENQLKPEITKKISQLFSTHSAEQVAKEIIQGIQKGKFTIIPGWEGKLGVAFIPIIGRYYYHYTVSQVKKELQK